MLGSPYAYSSLKQNSVLQSSSGEERDSFDTSPDLSRTLSDSTHDSTKVRLAQFPLLPVKFPTASLLNSLSIIGGTTSCKAIDRQYMCCFTVSFKKVLFDCEPADQHICSNRLVSNCDALYMWFSTGGVSGTTFFPIMKSEPKFILQHSIL